MSAQRYTEAKKITNQRWDKENLDRISIALRKGTKDEIKDHAAAQGESMNEFIQRAIKETMQRDKEKPRE